MMKKYIKCEATDESGKKIQCTELAELLSWQEKPVANSKTEGEVDRLLRYRCPDGHSSSMVITTIVQPPEPLPQVPSVKRFHKKGFSGHVRKVVKRPQPVYDPTMTNHARHTLRQAKRKMAKEMA